MSSTLCATANKNEDQASRKFGPERWGGLEYTWDMSLYPNDTIYTDCGWNSLLLTKLATYWCGCYRLSADLRVEMTGHEWRT